MSGKTLPYDIAFVGHYTKDTIVSSAGTRLVDGGACNYGANVAARMGLRVAVVTRLAQKDFHVVEGLQRLGIDVHALVTPASTGLRLHYPSSNVDERVITLTSSAGPFTTGEVEDLEARVFLIGASLRGEVSPEVVEELAGKETTLAADVQSFLRVMRDGVLVAEEWPEKRQVLSRLDVLKTDAVEAELLTGQSDIRAAAQMIADLGPSEVVLTHRNGLLVLADGMLHEAPFHPRELVGRSGRGDTTISAYMCKRLTASPAEATIWAAAVASLKMEAEGPFRREIGEVEDLISRKYKLNS
jgi:sugar/nucleoside kinase (ribokinase family)